MKTAATMEALLMQAHRPIPPVNPYIKVKLDMIASGDVDSPMALQ